MKSLVSKEIIVVPRCSGSETKSEKLTFQVLALGQSEGGAL